MKKSPIGLSAAFIAIVLAGGTLVTQAATGPANGQMGIQGPSIGSGAETQQTTPPTAVPETEESSEEGSAISDLYFGWTIPKNGDTIQINYKYKDFRKLRVDVYDPNDNFVKTVCRHGQGFGQPSEYKMQFCSWNLKNKKERASLRTGLYQFKIFGSNSASGLQYPNSNKMVKKGINDNVGTDSDDPSYTFLEQSPRFKLTLWSSEG